MRNNFEIHLAHDHPVSADALQQALALVTRCAERASLRMLDLPELRPAGLTEDQLKAAKAIIAATSKDAFWLIQVEPGSSRFVGVLKALAIGSLSALLSKAGHDILKETQIYQDVKEGAVAYMDEKYLEYLKAEIESYPYDPDDPDQIRVELQIEGDRLRLWVTPGTRQTDTTGLV